MTVLEMLTYLVVAGMGSLIAIQATVVLLHLRATRNALEMRQSVAGEPVRANQPPATVILGLRGSDPFLKSCIRSILAQQYPDFEVVCVLDSASDPARSIISEFESDDRLSVLVAEEHRDTCSLKNNSLVTAIAQLRSQTEVVVSVDADVVVDERWLQDLVSALTDQEVVACSGYRWYAPRDSSDGSMVRYLWNLAATPQVSLYQILWGGSLALRRDFVDASNLSEIWSRSLFDDTLVLREASRRGKRVAMVHDLVIPNREQISLANTYRWMRRQLLDVRLYHRSCVLTASHCFFSAAVLLLTLVILTGSVIEGNWMSAAVAAFSLLCYATFYYVILVKLESSARIAMSERYCDFPPSPGIGWKTCWQIVLTQAVYTISMVAVIMARKTRWRGVEYRFSRPGRSHSVEMIEYIPMSTVDIQGNSDGSLEA